MWQLKDIPSIFSKYADWEVKENNNTLTITNEDGIQAYLAVSGEQILVEVLLFNRNQVKDSSSLNEQILRTHKMFPLSTIGINDIEGESYYVAFGSLSSQSKAESIEIEVTTLFRNVKNIIELYQDELKVEMAQ
jgi:uncharacterized protein